MPTEHNILIVTNEMDMHADIILLMLRERGYEPIRLHTSDIPMQSVLSLSFTEQDWQGYIRINQRVVDIATIRSIWWRRPKPYALPSSLSRQEREFARLELEQTLNGLWASRDCYWISFPTNIQQASWKPDQLKRAAQLGFDVPRTLISTDPEQVRAFYATCNGQMIYKTLSDPNLAAFALPEQTAATPEELPPQHATYTTLITDVELSFIDTVRLAPYMFQEYVPKRYELRVTVIGDDLFAAEIYSQDHETTTIDWRHHDVDIPYRKAVLPPEIAERCYALTKSYGLNFSAIDLIFTPDGRYVFLENNPNGQFLFVQQKVPELKMAEALVDYLIRGGHHASIAG